MDRGLEFFRPEGVDVGQVDEAKCFSISSRDFRRIVRKDLYVPYHGRSNATILYWPISYLLEIRR